MNRLFVKMHKIKF